MSSRRTGAARSALWGLFGSIVVIVSVLRFWAVRKRAPFYKGANLRICVENSGIA